MPVDGKPDRVHVGARALNLDDWFEINEDYEDYVAYKLKLLSTKHDEVFVSLPLGDHGSREVLALMREHLPRVFPQRWPAGVTVDESRHPLEAASLLVQEDLALMTQVGSDWILSRHFICYSGYINVSQFDCLQESLPWWCSHCRVCECHSVAFCFQIYFGLVCNCDAFSLYYYFLFSCHSLFILIQINHPKVCVVPRLPLSAQYTLLFIPYLHFSLCKYGLQSTLTQLTY